MTVLISRSSPRRRSAASIAVTIRKPSVACVWATHQSSGTGGTTWRARSFLSSRLPTWGPLPCVLTTSWPCATSSAICSHAPSTAMRCDSGSAPRSPAIALPPRATTRRSLTDGGLVEEVEDLHEVVRRGERDALAVLVHLERLGPLIAPPVHLPADAPGAVAPSGVGDQQQHAHGMHDREVADRMCERGVPVRGRDERAVLFRTAAKGSAARRSASRHANMCSC